MDKRNLADQVVVITGASSGIGRATAFEFAKNGASLVLVARGQEALHDVEREVRGFHDRVRCVPADVANPDEVERVADVAMSEFGRIDTWVNNAGIDEWAKFIDHTTDEIERIIATNLLGTMYGAKAALKRMNGPATIINVGSVESVRPMPLQSAYAASKHGVKGFTDTLRMELKADQSPVDVVLMMPTFIDTPLYEHAGAKLGGAEPKPVQPVYAPSTVAEAIVFAAQHPRNEIVIGGAGKAFVFFDKIAPHLFDAFLVKTGFYKLQKSDRTRVAPPNLFKPSRSYRVRGGVPALRSSLWTRWVEQRPIVQRALLGGLAIGATALLLRRTR